jgi:ACT domain-containing protein
MAVTEEQIRRIVEETRRQLGDGADIETLKAIVRETVRRLEEDNGGFVQEHPSTFQYLHRTEGRIIVTAFGKNHPGIISAISETLARCRCDILDVSQKIMQEFFTLIMLVDIRNADCPFGVIKENLARASEQLSVRILAQHEDVFNAMHRI